MVIARAILATPIVIAWCNAPALRCCWTMVTCCARTALHVILELFVIGRGNLLTLSRRIRSAITMVGGNIRGHPRTITTTSALETSKGDLALALWLGLILIPLSVTVTAFLLAGWSTRGRS
jgi:tungstate transport system permease protein